MLLLGQTQHIFHSEIWATCFQLIITPSFRLIQDKQQECQPEYSCYFFSRDPPITSNTKIKIVTVKIYYQVTIIILL
jgi:hypothetical protein